MMSSVLSGILYGLLKIGDAQVNFPGCHNGKCSTGLPTVAASSGALKTILQIGFGVIGGVALIIIIISAMSFITSGGDEQKVKQARETLLYALIGLAVCVSAELVVTYVLNNV
jgi:hypothetical protein